jgi:predicted TPR repeat methyltransferase
VPTFEISFPTANAGADQDAETCEVLVDGDVRRFRFHDYDKIYRIPGLYEKLFYDVLECRSPDVVCGLLGEQLEAGGWNAGDTTVLDLGAGNGIVGECLTKMGCGTVVGVDIIPEAAEAAERDRPGAYAEYVVGDLTDPTPEVHEALGKYRFGVLTTVAALGFGDIPPAAFHYAYDLLVPGGWLAFCIKEDFLADDEPTGFAKLIRDLMDAGSLEVFAQRRYRHRLSAQGQPLHYVAMIGRKAST